MVEREIPEPVPGSVRIKVQACGICHSDSYTRRRPDARYSIPKGARPRGNRDYRCGRCQRGRDGPRDSESVWVGMGEIAATATRVGAATLSPARSRAWLQASLPMGDMRITWLPERKLARVPEDLPNVDAAPLMCAGITTFNALRNSGARPGETVAVLGLGGLASWAHTTTSTMRLRTRRQPCKSSAARRPSWRR